MAEINICGRVFGARPQSVGGRRLVSTALVFMRNQVAQSSLPLLVAKVAQKPRTTSLAEARVAKPKTNATRVKRLPSLFLNGFATIASHDRLSRSLSRRRCEVRVLGAPLAQVLKKIPVNRGGVTLIAPLLSFLKKRPKSPKTKPPASHIGGQGIY